MRVLRLTGVALAIFGAIGAAAGIPPAGAALVLGLLVYGLGRIA